MLEDSLLLLAVSASLSLAVSLAVAYYTSRRVTGRYLRLLGLAGEYVASRLARRRHYKRRKRYVVFEVAGDRVSADAVDSALRSQIRKLLGVRGLSEMGYKLVYFSEEKRRGIIRVYSDYKLHLIGVLGLVRRVDGTKIAIYPIATTGSLKKAGQYVGK